MLLASVYLCIPFHHPIIIIPMDFVTVPELFSTMFLPNFRRKISSWLTAHVSLIIEYIDGWKGCALLLSSTFLGHLRLTMPVYISVHIYLQKKKKGIVAKTGRAEYPCAILFPLPRSAQRY